MKGLIRNNFYTVEGSLKATLLLSLIAGIVLVIAGKLPMDSDNLFSMIIAGNLGGFGALSMTVMQKDAASKWNKFELTMPVSRNDVITARYLSCMLYVLIGVVMALLTALAFYLTAGAVNLERMGYGFIFGLGFALSMPTFTIPLTLILGDDKIEPILVISILAGMTLLFCSNAIMTPLFRDAANGDFLFRLSYVVLILVLFMVSYLISCRLYEKKEL